MSSLSILNKAIPRASGMGLPFYVSPFYIFSKDNVEFNSTNGLWFVPRNKVPTFQIHIPKDTPNPWEVKTVKYFESKGAGEFTGYVVSLPIASVQMVRGAIKNGQQIYIFQSSDNYDIPEPPRCGRWIIELTIEEGGVVNIYYSEEFLTIDL